MDASVPISYTSSRLCAQCQALNLDALFTDEQWNCPVAISNPKPDECHFCAALEFIRPGVSRTDKIIRLVQLRHPSQFSGVRITVATKEDPAVWTPHKTFAESCLPGSITLKADLECCEKSLLDGAFSSGYANFDLHRRWLQHCRDLHGSSCNDAPDGSLMLNLRLINCETKKIHQFKHVDVYSALSYQWGQDINAPEIQDELLQDLPPTIEDAILVTRELGIRYIWIDRYCIPQKDDDEFKDQQIRNMHRIYRGAEVTIVAAAGQSPQYGLTGVSRKKAIPPRLEIGKQNFVCTLPDPQLLIESSTWSTRGWTYQEALLSRRRLVLTDQQSYFQCNHTSSNMYRGRSEAISWLRANRPCEKVAGEEVKGFFEFGFRHNEIWSRINEYTSRNLSKEEDILNAMLGILETYAGTKWSDFDFWHFQGLPMYRMHEWTGPSLSWNNPFFINLSWEQPCPSSRRKGFPSWSWTGWTGSDFIGPYESLWPVMHNDFRYSKILTSFPTDDGTEVSEANLDRLINDDSGHPTNWNVRYITISTPCVAGFIRARDSYPPTILDESEYPSKCHLPLVNEYGLVFTMENRGRSYSYNFQLQLKDLASNPALKIGISCLSLLLDLNEEEAQATEGTKLNYHTDSQGRLRWGAAAILAIRNNDNKGGTYERIGKLAIPRRHLIGTSDKYRAVRLQ